MPPWNGGNYSEADLKPTSWSSRSVKLHVYRRVEEAEPVVVWLKDDATFYRRVVVGQA
jgi:hypothetical protein